MAFGSRGGAGILASGVLLGAAFFPEPPAGPLERAFGTVTSFGVGNASGTVTLDGTRSFALAANVAVDGKPNRCDHPPLGGRPASPANCGWPADLVIGKTTVIVRYFTAKRPDGDEKVEVAADVAAVASPATDLARAKAGDAHGFRSLLTLWPMADGGPAEKLSDQIAAATAAHASLALATLATLPASDQAYFREQPQPLCARAARAAVERAEPPAGAARAWRKRILASCPTDPSRIP